MPEHQPPAASAFPPPPGFVLPVRIYYEDTDAGGVVYYANYLRFCERARSEWLRALGFEQRHLLKDGGPIFVVRRVQADYLSPARLDDSLTVVNTIGELRHASVCFLQRIFRNDALLFAAKIKIACVSTSQGRPAPWPAALRDRFRAQIPSPSA
ncbi:MAG: tol-pal system-associated acyl-CoA thioesterase [Azoarcus sp.]|jgi:acyl-CoA thioester hydrolase|nr:tol-pal system-associated acyl-CoA thioesterase [Azoarcus sp.]